jgi:excinuclease ABC subunit C
VDGAMKKSEYRRFNINGITGGDDYAAMRQALTRCYQKVMRSGIHSDDADGTGDMANVPDLVLIDGGKGQHGIAREVFAELGSCTVAASRYN